MESSSCLLAFSCCPYFGPFPCSYGGCYGACGQGCLLESPRKEARATTSATPSPTVEIVSKETPTSLESLKTRFLDQIRIQKAVSMADFRRDQEIEIEIQPEANFDSAKAKNVALTVAKGWQKISGQAKVSVSVWQGVNLLAKESVP